MHRIYKSNKRNQMPTMYVLHTKTCQSAPTHTIVPTYFFQVIYLPCPETYSKPLKIPSRWLELPKNRELCGAATGLAQIPVFHFGFPRVESYALWLENIRPGK